MLIPERLKKDLIQLTSCTAISDIQLIQGVWGGYGQLLRFYFIGSNINSVVVKLVNKPPQTKHPKGWNTNRSHQRKLFSYQVESYWYKHYQALHQQTDCYIPSCLSSGKNDTQQWLVLEDLREAGFPLVEDNCSIKEAKVCVTWLAKFHALHLQREPEGLWSTGTYWHLDTRPDELKNLQDEPLKASAKILDNILSSSPFQTLVHGDAKLANFCFSETNHKVAVVDFQYVGQGCGMKDLILFISSAIPPNLCELQAPILMDHYFRVLQDALSATSFDGQEVEDAWRPLYSIAWADFQRFVKGWSPEHWKINEYTESLTKKALKDLGTVEDAKN